MLLRKVATFLRQIDKQLLLGPNKTGVQARTEWYCTYSSTCKYPFCATAGKVNATRTEVVDEASAVHQVLSSLHGMSVTAHTIGNVCGAPFFTSWHH